jgi:transcriptional regulator with PAS, ATPase and Fis domain|tara:strand:- start:53 stop:313 length:261 start_codon:yes stop_codon:yes gene_type:complete
MPKDYTYEEEQLILWNSFDEIWPKNTIEEFSLVDEMHKIEYDHLQNALLRTDGNRTKAAEILGIGRTCLIAKLKKFNLLDVCQDKI